ncbi:Ku protein [Priestia endophytica]|jgi:DNA end-binding protein Ku|uniref:Non-homologous end joining protein Ku n=2 Tax=Priestia endophytica TaxID=135735 RepID=A0AAX1QD95_9BACI|nr:Ku protein [Priestia endophytica]RAS82001.1 Ku protein [Priestia endophytica]RAS84636.1 Ku protein [Priestia endophytica]
MKEKQYGKRGENMLHTIWKGQLHFGTIEVPIRLHSAVENSDVKLRLLHRECSTPIKQKRICPHCNVEVDHNDLVRGYEREDGTFIQLEEEEINMVKAPFLGKELSIFHFLKKAEIDPLYYNKTFFVLPLKENIKAYEILRAALQATNTFALTKIFLYSSDQYAVIRSYQNILALHTLHPYENIRHIRDDRLSDQVSAQDQKLAVDLIENLTEPFHPEVFHDDYQEALLKYIHEKEEKPKQERTIAHMMEALKASIDQSMIETKPPKNMNKKPRATS